jgi:hypothetical protein
MLQSRSGSEWGQDLRDGHQHEIPGYVPPPVNSNPYNVSLHDIPEAPWNNGPASVPPHALNNDYLGYTDHPDQVDGFLMSPPPGISPPGTSYPIHYEDYPWTLSSEYPSNETEPG